MRPARQNLTRKNFLPQRPQLQEGRSNSNNSCKKSSSNTIAGLYDLGDTIGKGHYAVVKVAHHVFTGEKVAVKVIDKTKLDDVSKAHLFQEVRCMKLVQHANVVRLYQVIDTQSKLYLILEYADGGDLFDYIMKHSEGLDEHQARDYFQQILYAIDFCHKLHVVHRDLKPENVVFFKNQKTVKLTDFGFSNKFIPGNKLDTSCGSLAYSAPEILLGVSYDAPAVDIWSLGVVLYMLVCGQAPFQEANDSETLTMIMDCTYSVPEYVSEPCKDLISLMLVREPSERAKLEELMGHDWLAPSSTPPSPPSLDLPLVCRQALTMDDHTEVVEKMVAGGFASLREITESLDNQAYDHITATYYLLAERLLRKRFINNPLSTHPTSSPHLSPDDLASNLSPLALSPRCSSPINNNNNRVTNNNGNNATQRDTTFNHTPLECLVSPPGHHSHLSPSSSSSSTFPEHSNINSLRHQLTLLKPPSPHHKPSATSTPSLSPYSLVGHMPALSGRPLCNVHSSPQLLNEICEEEDESENEDNKPPGQSPPLSSQTTKKFESSSRRRCVDKRNRLGGRPGGCSSEDVSDSEDVKDHGEGTEKRNNPRTSKEGVKKEDESKRGVYRVGGCCPSDARRDSSEHSSDTDGGGCFGGRTKPRGYRYHHHHPLQVSNKKDEGNHNNNNSSGYKCGNHSDYEEYNTQYDNNNTCHYGNNNNADITNPLRAALIKLNVPLNETFDDEEEEDDNNNNNILNNNLTNFNNLSNNRIHKSHHSHGSKHCLELKTSTLFSVLEENSPPSSHHHLTHPPETPTSPHHPTTRKSSSLINISSFLQHNMNRAEELLERGDDGGGDGGNGDGGGDDGDASHDSCCCFYCCHDNNNSRIHNSNIHNNSLHSSLSSSSSSSLSCLHSLLLDQPINNNFHRRGSNNFNNFNSNNFNNNNFNSNNSNNFNNNNFNSNNPWKQPFMQPLQLQHISSCG